MGKVEELRALREARFSANQKPLTPAAKKAAAVEALTKAATPAAVSDVLCGHRSVGGKSCIREEGHVATGTKSHRYAKA